MLNSIKYKASHWIRYNFIAKKLGFFELFSNSNKPEKQPDNLFTTSDGRDIPILNDYRYNLVPDWRGNNWLMTAYELLINNILNKKDKRFFVEAFGTNSLAIPVQEFKDKIKQITPSISKYILDGPVVKPSLGRISSRIQQFYVHNSHLMKKLKDLGIQKFSNGMKLLEIGYSSGGYSLFAFDKLGFECHGVDNYYGSKSPNDSLPHFIKNQIKNSVRFSIGDICKTTPYPDNYFDIVFSASVLEHITDIPAAFNEMRRIVKPNGTLVHGYNPFFCLNGGHKLGTLDSPWSHLRLSSEDLERYIQKLRPLEIEISSAWNKHSLNRISTNQVQQELAKARLNVKLWEQHPTPKRLAEQITPEIFEEASHIYPSINYGDLISEVVFFIAQKSLWRYI